MIPEQWKLSNIIPIQKIKNTIKAEEFRPINTLPPDEKIIEKYVKAQLVEYIYDNEILVKQQSGFRKNHSCETTINYVINKINGDVEKDNKVIVVFLDLKRAFETVDRNILLEKLNNYGIQKKELKWFENYLNERKQKTRFNNVESKELEIKIGLPQGSALGPILFLMYINDIIKAPRFGEIILFAHDTALIIKSINIEEAIKKTNKDLDEIDKWLKSNKLMLNVSKTKWMTTYKNKKINITDQYVLKINNEKIEKMEVMKYLGIQIDDKMTFEKHIQISTNNLARKVNLLYRI